MDHGNAPPKNNGQIKRKVICPPFHIYFPRSPGPEIKIMSTPHHSEVEAYIQKLDRWKEETILLREILLEAGLAEDWKWRQPCYTLDGENLIIIGNFKDSIVLSFLKGALLSDPYGWMVRPGEHTQSGRFLRFTDPEDIRTKTPQISAYVREAIDHARKGTRVEKRPEDVEIGIPEELQQRFQEDNAFESAFRALTHGRQRAYLMFFTATQTPATRFNRIEKFRPRILDGKGLNDCVCGLSRKMPGCDGSHKLMRSAV
jgi:uncharacterized protein YdeI (YjbR/CyaY-like superfamily)